LDILSVSLVAANNWWEPGTPNIFDIGDMAAFFGLLIAGSTVVFGITRWWMKLMRKMVKEELTIATAQIQPHANGGLSSQMWHERPTNLNNVWTSYASLSKRPKTY
jgi:hypothetical protein